MDFTRVPSDKASALVTTLNSPTTETLLEKTESPATKVMEMSAEPTKPMKPMKLRAAPRKVWWPSSCRGIVG